MAFVGQQQNRALNAYLRAGALQQETDGLNAEAFLRHRHQTRNGDAQQDAETLARISVDTRESPGVATYDVEDSGISISKRLTSLASIKRFNSKLALLPEAAARRLHARAQSIGRLKPESRRWLHIDVYGDSLAPDEDGDDSGQSISTWRYYMKQLHTLMTEPDSSRTAYLISLLVLASIIISTITFVLDTVPSLDGPLADRVFNVTETVTIQVFALDYILRLVSAPSMRLFVISPLNIIDLISFLPWYILTASGGGNNNTSVFRVLRLLRVFRIFKLGGKYNKIDIVLFTLQSSWELIALICFFLILLIIIYATLMFVSERGDWDPVLGEYVRQDEPGYHVDMYGNITPAESPYSSIPHGFWWAIVTLMTVGYGDATPITAPGKLIAGCAMISGVLMLALPISVIGSNFVTAWMELKDQVARNRRATIAPRVKELSDQLVTHLNNTEDLAKLFATAEQELDALRNKLYDKVKSRKKDLEASMMASKQLTQNAATLAKSSSALAFTHAARAVAAMVKQASLNETKRGSIEVPFGGALSGPIATAGPHPHTSSTSAPEGSTAGTAPVGTTGNTPVPLSTGGDDTARPEGVARLLHYQSSSLGSSNNRGLNKRISIPRPRASTLQALLAAATTAGATQMQAQLQAQAYMSRRDGAGTGSEVQGQVQAVEGSTGCPRPSLLGRGSTQGQQQDGQQEQHQLIPQEPQSRLAAAGRQPGTGTQSSAHDTHHVLGDVFPHHHHHHQQQQPHNLPGQPPEQGSTTLPSASTAVQVAASGSTGEGRRPSITSHDRSSHGGVSSSGRGSTSGSGGGSSGGTGAVPAGVTPLIERRSRARVRDVDSAADHTSAAPSAGSSTSTRASPLRPAPSSTDPSREQDGGTASTPGGSGLEGSTIPHPPPPPPPATAPPAPSPPPDSFDPDNMQQRVAAVCESVEQGPGQVRTAVGEVQQQQRPQTAAPAVLQPALVPTEAEQQPPRTSAPGNWVQPQQPVQAGYGEQPAGAQQHHHLILQEQGRGSSAADVVQSFSTVVGSEQQGTVHHHQQQQQQQSQQHSEQRQHHRVVGYRAPSVEEMVSPFLASHNQHHQQRLQERVQQQQHAQASSTHQHPHTHTQQQQTGGNSPYSQQQHHHIQYPSDAATQGQPNPSVPLSSTAMPPGTIVLVPPPPTHTSHPVEPVTPHSNLKPWDGPSESRVHSGLSRRNSALLTLSASPFAPFSDPSAIAPLPAPPPPLVALPPRGLGSSGQLAAGGSLPGTGNASPYNLGLHGDRASPGLHGIQGLQPLLSHNPLQPEIPPLQLQVSEDARRALHRVLSQRKRPSNPGKEPPPPSLFARTSFKDAVNTVRTMSGKLGGGEGKLTPQQGPSRGSGHTPAAAVTPGGVTPGTWPVSAAGSGGGAPDKAAGVSHGGTEPERNSAAAMREVHPQEFTPHLHNIMGAQMLQRYHKDLAEMRELEVEMISRVKHLQNLLRVTGMLRGVSFPEVIKEMRFKYRQFEFMDQETQDGKVALAEMAGEVAEVELLLADLEQRFNWVTPEPGSQEAEAALDRAWLEVQAAQEGLDVEDFEEHSSKGMVAEDKAGNVLIHALETPLVNGGKAVLHVVSAVADNMASGVTAMAGGVTHAVTSLASGEGSTRGGGIGRMLHRVFGAGASGENSPSSHGAAGSSTHGAYGSTSHPTGSTTTPAAAMGGLPHSDASRFTGTAIASGMHAVVGSPEQVVSCTSGRLHVSTSSTGGDPPAPNQASSPRLHPSDHHHVSFHQDPSHTSAPGLTLSGPSTSNPGHSLAPNGASQWAVQGSHKSGTLPPGGILGAGTRKALETLLQQSEQMPGGLHAQAAAARERMHVLEGGGSTLRSPHHHGALISAGPSLSAPQVGVPGHTISGGGHTGHTTPKGAPPAAATASAFTRRGSSATGDSSGRKVLWEEQQQQEGQYDSSSTLGAGSGSHRTELASLQAAAMSHSGASHSEHGAQDHLSSSSAKHQQQQHGSTAADGSGTGASSSAPKMHFGGSKIHPGV